MYPIGSKVIDPKLALPFWLQFSPYENNPLIHSNDVLIEDHYSRWVLGKGYKSYTKKDGTYHIIDETEETIPKLRRFKCYIERGDLASAFVSGKLTSLIDDLVLIGLGPNRVKLGDAQNLMFYFFKDVTSVEDINEIFKDRNVKLRGPAQDVCEVKFDEEGQLKVEIKTSNDGALADKTPIEYKLTEYNQVAFLDNYLQLCLWAGKDPSEPYKTSFVYFLDPNGQAGNNQEELVAQASQMVGYPVVYAGYRLDVARK